MKYWGHESNHSFLLSLCLFGLILIKEKDKRKTHANTNKT